MAVAALALVAAGSLLSPTPAFAETDRMQDRQDAREGARDIKRND